MRTKTLVLTALLGLAASPMFAQTNVYSVNAVGYVQVVFQPNVFTMVGNPLNTTNNSIGSLFTAFPNGTQFYKWNGATYDIAQFLFGAWDNPQYTLNPGEGCFIQTKGSAPWTNTFVGEVLQGNLTNSIPNGFSQRSSMVPQAGDADSLGLSAALKNGDSILEYNAGKGSYDIWQYLFGQWSDPVGGSTPPPMAVAQSVFIGTSAAPGPRNWSRSFSVNN
jgi:hypothetical protein